MEKEEMIDTIKQFACSLAEKELADKIRENYPNN